MEVNSNLHPIDHMDAQTAGFLPASYQALLTTPVITKAFVSKYLRLNQAGSNI
jgi:hypothetical protein